ncbi:alpha-mannosidase [Haloactinomyces albus]|uniref:alpha-mannosidase n=1 Tax=Haloactinomyces albus TaxID=1352928 RepID=A0AAE3Z9M2_9ACTN|nr:glycoside hydrolase family 38 C-terminal domain-containing protein [Haloactinomyces albus]MDR7299865.1 alpha-mannosidase [Haloactinomyces albus]
MHDDRTLVEHRIDRVLTERLRPAQYRQSTGCRIGIGHTGDPVPVEQALQADYTPAAVGDTWGPAWTTTWFRLEATIPTAFAGHPVEALLDLGFDTERPGFQCEALVHAAHGEPIKGLHPRSTHIPVSAHATAGQQHTFYIEATANPDLLGPRGFRPTPLADPATAGHHPLYRIERAEIAPIDHDVAALVADIDVLTHLMHTLDAHTPRRGEILRALERMLDHLDLHDIHTTAPTARTHLAEVLAQPAHASAHRISAIGHAHIDSAWLWPLRETVRKVARTVANVTTLMDQHPDFLFAMSQAQQLDWLKQHSPSLFERARTHIAAGRFIPVGSMWVESDTNLPGGEALARQLVHGKRFYLDEFDLETREIWLPDSFGYSAALPQLATLAGAHWMLTQKLSWNHTNPFPHHTFWWEGIDGTRLFTHFPPVDTYNAALTGTELAHAGAHFAEHGHARRSLVPFGHGDGGGGPTREMLARADRTADLEGSPRVQFETPTEFFRAAHAEHTDPAVWVGELYLEAHRGTYTSQAATKRGNRRNEHLLREAELWCATATIAGLADYPYDTLDRLWKTVLLHQFHDILPGTSIAWVHREATEIHQQVTTELTDLIEDTQRHLAAAPGNRAITFNAAPHTRHGITALAAAPAEATTTPTAETHHDGTITLDNGLLHVAVDTRGLLTSVFDRAADRELLAPNSSGNLLQLHPDHPNAWDAWDIDAFHRHTTHEITDADNVTLDGTGPSPTVRVHRTVGASTIVQRLHLAAAAPRVNIDTDIDWHESEKLLKTAFPLDVHTDTYTAEIQFGHLHRPTHTNTSWDAAKFENCAHRWIHLGEPDYGIALVNDATYGHDVTRHPRRGGGTTTTARLSLLRAPRFPDPHTDHGRHRLTYALIAGADIGDAIREGYRTNLPERTITGTHTVDPLLHVDNDNVIIEAIKLADDRSGDVIARLYESRGGRARTRLTPSFTPASILRTDLLERPLDQQHTTDDTATLHLRPFEIVTLRLTRPD